MTEKAPITVYLDTQDFTNLLRPERENAIVLDYLLSEVAAKRIRIGYSYPIVFELLRNYDQDHKPARIKLAQAMNMLCKGNAFPYPSDLKQGAKFPNRGIWMPLDALTQFEPKSIEKLVIESIREKLSENPRLNRKSRRLLGSLAGLRSVVRDIPIGDFAKEDFAGIPISEDFLHHRYVQRFIAGGITRQRFSQEFTRWLSDPEYAIQIWYEYAGKENPLETLVGNAYHNLEIGLLNVRELIKTARERRQMMKVTLSELHKSMHSLNLSDQMRKSLQPPKLPLLEIPSFRTGLDAVFGPGRDAQFNHYLNLIVEGRFEPARSDVGDLLHLIYLSDVDLFRCDRRMFSIMKSCREMQVDKLVPRLVDLPKRIELLKNNTEIDIPE